MLRNTLFGLVNHSIVCKRICRYTVSKQLWRKYVKVKHPVGIVQQQFNYLFFFLWLRISQMKNMTNKQNTVADPATMALITFCPGLPFVVVSLLITSVVPVRWSVAGAVCIKQLQSKGTGNLLTPLKVVIWSLKLLWQCKENNCMIIQYNGGKMPDKQKASNCKAISSHHMIQQKK